MNLERLQQAINVMKRAGEVDMGSWQCAPGDIATSECELHTCGTPACFAGWVAVSPEFQSAGGKVGPVSGAPMFHRQIGYEAILEWLEVEGELQREVLRLLIIGEDAVLESTVWWLRDEGFEVHSEKDEPESDYSYAAFENWRDFNAQDVIKVLEALKKL